jgi:hypothetical protein
MGAQALSNSGNCIKHHPKLFRQVSAECSHLLVGPMGLDPGALGLKGTFHRLFCVGLVAHVHCFQGIVSF